MAPGATTAERGPTDNPNKLTRPDEFRAALAAECRVSSQNFLVRALANSGPAARLGLIVSRKAAPRSVDRNRGKRLTREAFRAARADLPAVDIVFQQKNNLRKMSNPLIRCELDRLLCDVAARFGVRSDTTPSALSILKNSRSSQN